MADKQRLRRGIKQLNRVKTWQLLILLILAVFIAATFLRLNNIGMVERRAAVESADEQGNSEVITQRLYDLQRYVSSHMNTDLGAGVYLEHSYNRDYKDWQAHAYGNANPNGNVYKKAQEVCEPRFSRNSMAYLLCTTGELEKYPSYEEDAKPNANIYRHSFTSPLWSPDFAGWSIVVCVVLALLILGRLITLGILKMMLRRHYRSA